VLCDGPAPSPALLDYWLAGADLFVCCDAAGWPHEALPRRPDAVIGDFDTLAGRVIAGGGPTRWLRDPAQDTTDSEKALLWLVAQKVDEAVLLGATGDRLDHTLFNCGLVERFAGRLRVCLTDAQHDCVRVGPGEEVAWDLRAGTLFSLLPLAGPATGVAVANALWPLEKTTIRTAGPATVSNRVLDPPLRIAVTGGSLLVTVQRQGWPA